MADSARFADARHQASLWRLPAVWLGLAAVALARLLTLPRSLWEYDEVLFVRGVEHFAPLQHRPHPPGYPLVIGFGKALAPLVGDPFFALVTASVIASLIGYLALVDAYTRIAAGNGEWRKDAVTVGVVGALLFHLSPPMLLYGPLALSDAPALAFAALALAAAARLSDGGAPAGVALGAFAAAAVGCRPQLVVAVVPMVVTALVVAAVGKGSADWRGRVRSMAAPSLAALAGFVVVVAAWLVPLAAACGGAGGLAALVGKQAGLVATVDADAARGAVSLPALVARFVAHPWGPKQLSVPVLAAAAGGFVTMVRRRRLAALPLVVLAAANLAFALAAMDPADAVRYALPSLLAVSWLAAVGLDALAGALRLRAVTWLAAAALCAGFVLFTAPILRARAAEPSPPAQAAAWARAHLPGTARLLVAPPLVPHAAQLLAGRAFTVADPGPSPSGEWEELPAFLLADGESGWPGAVAFHWPRSEAWGKLTRGYYRVVSWSPLPDCRLMPLSGVYGWEPGWRWLDREASLRVATEAAPALDVTLGLPPTSPYPWVDVELEAAGGGATHLRVDRGSRSRARLPLPPRPEVELRLRADRSFVPAEAGIGTDRRRLAVQLVACAPRGRR